MKPSILVVGSMNMDLVMYGIQDLPAWGTSTFGTEYRYAAGGKGANQAVASARAGAKTTIITKIGKDYIGYSILENFNYNIAPIDFETFSITKTGILVALGLAYVVPLLSVIIPLFNLSRKKPIDVLKVS